MTLLPFTKNTIWAYPTDTSFGLGVRIDDRDGLQKLHKIKKRNTNKYFSLMVADWDMLSEFAELPEVYKEKNNNNQKFSRNFFTDKPRTALLRPTDKLPKTPYWPADKVGFRLCLNEEIARYITCPITATSANISGVNPIFDPAELLSCFDDQIYIWPNSRPLPIVPASEILDLTANSLTRIR